MKNLILIGGVTLTTAVSSQAAVVYTDDFSGSYTAESGVTIFDGTTIAPGSWFGANDVGVSGGVLNLGVASENRSRGSAVWVSTAGWEAGTITVEFDVTNYTAGSQGAIAFFRAYGASGVDASNTVGMDPQGPGSAGIVLSSTGSASIGVIDTGVLITSNGNDQTATFTYNGTDEYVALLFGTNSPNVGGSPNIGAFATIDNLVVSDTAMIPEPSSTALLGLGGLAFILRRRK